jgi:hypothetical protein
LVGFGQFTTFSVVAGSTSIPASDTTLPTYFTLRVKNEHFSGQKPWQWEDEQVIAFETLKQQLILAPILGYANFELPFEIHTNTSGTSLGTILYQEQDGFKKVISYASRGLTCESRREVQSLHSRVLELISIVASVFQML